MRGCLPIGPSLLENGQRMSCSEPDVASHLPPAVHAIERTFPEYPDIRMSLASARRHPCSVGSCIEVTRKRPSGENITSRCEPFQAKVSGVACAFGNHRVTPP